MMTIIAVKTTMRNKRCRNKIGMTYVNSMTMIYDSALT